MLCTDADDEDIANRCAEDMYQLNYLHRSKTYFELAVPLVGYHESFAFTIVVLTFNVKDFKCWLLVKLGISVGIFRRK